MTTDVQRDSNWACGLAEKRSELDADQFHSTIRVNAVEKLYSVFKDFHMFVLNFTEIVVDCPGSNQNWEKFSDAL